MAPLARTHDPPAVRPPGGPRALGRGAMGREDRGWAVEGARKGPFRIFPWPTVDAGLLIPPPRHAAPTPTPQMEGLRLVLKGCT